MAGTCEYAVAALTSCWTIFGAGEPERSSNEDRSGQVPLSSSRSDLRKTIFGSCERTGILSHDIELPYDVVDFDSLVLSRISTRGSYATISAAAPKKMISDKAPTYRR